MKTDFLTKKSIVKHYQTLLPSTDLNNKELSITCFLINKGPFSNCTNTFTTGSTKVILKFG